MRNVHPQYITDTTGQKLVVLSEQDFNYMIEQLEDIEDVELYDAAKKDHDGKSILLEDYIKKQQA